jgi:hypothetical protein
MNDERHEDRGRSKKGNGNKDGADALRDPLCSSRLASRINRTRFVSLVECLVALSQQRVTDELEGMWKEAIVA